VWTRDDIAATDVIDARPDATVHDLGGFIQSGQYCGRIATSASISASRRNS
jgi:hypothetical protein